MDSEQIEIYWKQETLGRKTVKLSILLLLQIQKEMLSAFAHSVWCLVNFICSYYNCEVYFFCILSYAFSTPRGVITWDLFIILPMWCIILIDFWKLEFEPLLHLSEDYNLSWYNMPCGLQYFVDNFDIWLPQGYWHIFFLCCIFGLGIRIVAILRKRVCQSSAFSLKFWNILRRRRVSFSLNALKVYIRTYVRISLYFVWPN